MVINSLGVIGTLALILISGGIFVHKIDFLNHALPALPSLLNEALVGLIAGLLAVLVLRQEESPSATLA